jgi:hypothetical protein
MGAAAKISFMVYFSKRTRKKIFLIPYISTQTLKLSFDSCTQVCIIIFTIHDDYALHNINAVFFCDVFQFSAPVYSSCQKL